MTYVRLNANPDETSAKVRAELDAVVTEAANISYQDLNTQDPVDYLLFDIAHQIATARVKLRAAAGELVDGLKPIADGDPKTLLLPLANDSAPRTFDEALTTINVLQRTLALAVNLRAKVRGQAVGESVTR